jgi:branched-chain amino acid transport system ATP-binding protein
MTGAVYPAHHRAAKAFRGLAMSQAVRTIRHEHRDYLQVLECLCRLLDRLEERGGAKRRRLLFLILDYVEAFPATFHHPKEEDYLFAALRRRKPDYGPLLDRLHDEHAQALDLAADLRAACLAWRRDFVALPALRDAARRYWSFEEAHMRREERDILPLALESLDATDWGVIDAAFARDDDPLFGAPRVAQFERLLGAIHALASETLGARPESGRLSLAEMP